MREIALASGRTLHDCQNRLLAFCANEYAYYDGIPDPTPNEITPVDVLVTVSVNSRVGTGAMVQRVHRGMVEACTELLARVPVEADLLTFDQDLVLGEQLLGAALAMKNVGPAVATKVLHRKRRNYVPMLDSVVILYYLEAKGYAKSRHWRAAERLYALEPGMIAWRAFRDDLQAALSDVQELAYACSLRGYQMSRVRILEVLIWMEAEKFAWYRPAAGDPTGVPS